MYCFSFLFFFCFSLGIKKVKTGLWVEIQTFNVSAQCERMHIRRNIFMHLSVTQQMYSSICNNQIGHTLIEANNSRCHRNRMFIRCVKHFNLGVAYFNLHRKVWLNQSIFCVSTLTNFRVLSLL